MKIIVLTTETLHHAYFISELNKKFPLYLTVIEEKKIHPPFDTLHPFEKDREEYEKRFFFKGKLVKISDFSPSITVTSVNEISAVRVLEKENPDVVIVFGTTKISKEIINLFPETLINLHGGDPEQYRGLDTHLWAIYHNDLSNLVTTVHKVNAGLDEGEIILKGSIPVKKNMKLYELRAANTVVCVELVISALEGFKESGRFISEPQNQKGRYYSFMPSVLKEICVKKFEKYTSSF